MEEKWWKKFQSKDEELIAKEKEGNDNKPNVSENVKNENHDYKFEEEKNSENKKSDSKEIFSSAINFIQDLGDSIGKTIIDETKKIPANEELNNIIHDINDKAKNTAEQIAVKTNEFINSKEVSDAAFKAQEVMKDVVSEVKSWTTDPNVLHDLKEDDSNEVLKDNEEEAHCFECSSVSDEICEAGSVDDENPILEDFEGIKDKFNATMNSKEVQNAKTFAKEKYDEAKTFAKNTLNNPSVGKGIETVSDTLNNTFEDPRIKPTVENLKQTGEDVRKWVYEVSNKEEVRDSINQVKMKSKDAVDSITYEFGKMVNNPKVTTYYANGKEAIITSANKVNKNIKEKVGPIMIDESLKDDAIEWGETAIKLTKQSANLIVKSAVEIKNSTQVKKAVAYSKKTSKALFILGMQALNKTTKPKQITNNEIKHITINEEHKSHEEDE